MVNTRQTKGRVTAASHRRQSQDPDSPVKKFFKLVLPSTVKSNMMRIPTRFSNLLGAQLSDIVTFETPVGFKRSIKLKRINDEIWFAEGWSEFAEAHSISEGHFLLFEYKGNSSFRVMIFDVSACEIEYPTDAVLISDSDDENEIIDVTGTQGTRENDQSVKKRPRDIEFEKILTDVDAIKVLEAEEEEDKRVFRGKDFF
ncbi:unnamed protein product [Microthlaspi erraticum]|uniref:TF-B3 domain-containing protein n=1 Tax=Microthlaspi erraticum TaxID=1685480 RepID=A0A6D2KEU9_9BRAS|nr:unnamed protein product [Microthlaspi erraticum]